MVKKLVLGVAIATFGMISIACAGGGGPYPASERRATPALMLGIAVEFGDSINKADVGLTAKVVSSNHPDRFVVGGGVSYFPWSKDPAGQIGADLSAGYNFNNFGAMAGYDFLRWKPQVSAGYVPTSHSLYCNDPTYPILIGNQCFINNILSDARLKHDIQLVDTLDDGTKIYSFKYLWSDDTYVGVMAQDLLNNARTSQAVVTMANGFYAVNYKALGLKMTTLKRWKQDGRKAIAFNMMGDVAYIKKAA